ncbi:MAG: dTMP kinase [Neisseriaceae bacterium]|nr:dTMP kinase [Neisseriaceae bacterium]
MSGFFLTLDGVDGAGKSTQLAFIQDFLQQKHIDVVCTREPGGTQLGKSLRDLLLNSQSQVCADAETLLMFADRAQHLHELIIPALSQNKWVLSDRFTDATFAYQSGGRQIAKEKIEQLENWVQGDLRPDLTIILDIPVEIAIERIRSNRNLDRFEKEGIDFFERVRESYLNRAHTNPERYKIIDTNRTLSIIQNDIAQILLEVINQRSVS